jgi:acyl-[acyl-carrier-protein] desaturase
MPTPQALMEKVFLESFIIFFNLAPKRSWSLKPYSESNPTGIPWNKANPQSDPALAYSIETFGAVESYLPDFSSKMMSMIRKSDGRARYHTLWAAEELKHSMALETWLLASGHRTEQQRRKFHDQLMENGWEVPYETPRLVLGYQAGQELATYLTYHQTQLFAQKDNQTPREDQALQRVLFVLKRDENAHFGFYFQLIKKWFSLDPEGMLKDLKVVFKSFKMPAQILIPDIERRTKLVADQKIYTIHDFIEKVRDNILDMLGATKAYHLLDRSDRYQEYQAEMERIEKENSSIIQTSASPFLSHLADFSSDRIKEVEKIARERPKIQLPA